MRNTGLRVHQIELIRNRISPFGRSAYTYVEVEPHERKIQDFKLFSILMSVPMDSLGNATVPSTEALTSTIQSIIHVNILSAPGTEALRRSYILTRCPFIAKKSCVRPFS